MMPTDVVYNYLIGAVIFTLVSVVILIAYLNKRKDPHFKTHATICLLSSVLGTSLGWLAFAISKYQEEVSYLGLKLLFSGGALILYPFFLFENWFKDWLAETFKFQPREQRTLFHLGGIGIRLVDIMKLIMAVAYGAALVRILTLFI